MPESSEQNREHWTIEMHVSQLNADFHRIQRYKSGHPNEKSGYYESSVGSILNAYREGDLTFDEASALLLPAKPLNLTSAVPLISSEQIAEKIADNCVVRLPRPHVSRDKLVSLIASAIDDARKEGYESGTNEIIVNAQAEYLRGQAEARDEWADIESAPKDETKIIVVGTIFLCYKQDGSPVWSDKEYSCITSYMEDGERRPKYSNCNDDEWEFSAPGISTMIRPRRWMPLPPAPKERES